MTGLFYQDLERDLEDPQFLRAFVTEAVRIATIDAIINALDDARLAEGLTKAALARAIGAEPAIIRRLFSNPGANPTLGTIAEVAAALGLRISVEPLPPEELESVTEPLRAGRSAPSTAKHTTQLRQKHRGTASLA